MLREGEMFLDGNVLKHCIACVSVWYKLKQSKRRQIRFYLYFMLMKEENFLSSLKKSFFLIKYLILKEL